MTIDEIKELIQVFNESGVAELEVQRGENRLRLRRASLNQDYVVASAPAPVMVSAAPAAIAAPPGLTGQPAPNPSASPTATATARVREGGRLGGARASPVHHRVDEADERDRIRDGRRNRFKVVRKRAARGIW